MEVFSVGSSQTDRQYVNTSNKGISKKSIESQKIMREAGEYRYSLSGGENAL